MPSMSLATSTQRARLVMMWAPAASVSRNCRCSLSGRLSCHSHFITFD
jgi:hypothetical protein